MYSRIEQNTEIMDTESLSEDSAMGKCQKMCVFKEIIHISMGQMI